ncbi:hypothetical protein CBS101457_004365 [Exobasidium rhododendri]|nr:hypothetical protein CBS101457_004365 [Exobasidium rhododendri]
MNKTTKVLSIALLIADTPVPQVVAERGDYFRIYSEWLNKSLAAVPRHSWQDDYTIDITPFDVVKDRKYPDEGMIKDGLFDAIMITGSSASAYVDVPWINELVAYVKHVSDEHPLIRIMGICFGHQIVARALGGKVELNEEGWELGSYECQLTEDGRELLGYNEDESVMRIHQVHRDIVTEVPEQCINLATTSKTSFQGLAVRYPTDAPPIPSTAGTSSYMAFDVSDFHSDSSGPLPVRSAQILSVQGHPEFDEGIVSTVVNVRTETGILTGSVSEEALRRAKLPHDGVRLGMNFLAMLGVEPRKTDIDEALT